jgi:hypothetical protein
MSVMRLSGYALDSHSSLETCFPRQLLVEPPQVSAVGSWPSVSRVCFCIRRRRYSFQTSPVSLTMRFVTALASSVVECLAFYRGAVRLLCPFV